MPDTTPTKRCPICRGQKVCQCCKGAGISPTLSVKTICPLCYGNGKCWMCLGDGEIEQVADTPPPHPS